MKKILITEFMDQSAVDDLAGDFDVTYAPKLVDAPEALVAAVEDADAIVVRNRTLVDAELLDHAKKLKAVGRLGVGLDNIDLEQCKARGIIVLPATGANDLAVAEYVVGAVFALVRKCFHSFDDMVDGRWPRTRLMGSEVAGKCLGLIGFGSIAKETCRRALALGMEVCAYDPYLKKIPEWDNVRLVDMKTLLHNADVVSLHIPLTSETRHLLDADKIAMMKQGAVVINAARGGVVDETALISALESGHLGGAALDVFEIEPLTRKAGQSFANLDTVILTPHIAGITEESNVRVSLLTAQNVRSILKGKS